jgi:hypothetical protein
MIYEAATHLEVVLDAGSHAGDVLLGALEGNKLQGLVAAGSNSNSSSSSGSSSSNVSHERQQLIGCAHP